MKQTLAGRRIATLAVLVLCAPTVVLFSATPTWCDDDLSAAGKQTKSAATDSAKPVADDPDASSDEAPEIDDIDQSADSPSPVVVGEPTKEVTVEIIEGLPKQRSWKLPEVSPSAIWHEPSFGLVGLPSKYNDKGLIDDRATPLMVRATSTLQLAAGAYRFLIRGRESARLRIDGKLVADTGFRKSTGDNSGFESLPDVLPPPEPGMHPAPPAYQEKIVSVTLDGQPHVFALESVAGVNNRRLDLGELILAVSPSGKSFHLLAPELSVALTDEAWPAYAAAATARLRELNIANRRAADETERDYWQRRHGLAKSLWDDRPVKIPSVGGVKDVGNPIDRFLSAWRAKTSVAPPQLVDDFTFLRRVAIDILGVIPSREQIDELLQDIRPDRRIRAIDRMLADPRWADNWVPYWQDVLAENPGLLKPKLNNTGPFRYWILESFVDNKPIDRFVSELVMMEGSKFYGGPAGFALATANDAPLAEKSQIVARAFLGVNLKCARCHDAPYHPFTQADTFHLAAMFGRGEQTLPATSTVPIREGARKPSVTISLKPGDKLSPTWPFENLVDDLPEELLRNADDARERLALAVTSPTNERFAQVIVNRLWKRYFGWAFVEPVDDWHDAKPTHPELLQFLARELIVNDYDLKHIAELIFSSQAYQSKVPAKLAGAVTATPARRRMTAEQIVDSLFAATGKPMRAEMLNIDLEARSSVGSMFNLGRPEHGWQFATLSNERDRPALGLPVAQSVIDILQAFGWRESRQSPVGEREDETTALQPLVLANGLVSSRMATLSDDSSMTEVCLQNQPVAQLIDDVCLQLLCRRPTAEERELFVELLSPGYERRRTGATGPKQLAPPPPRNAISWANHHDPKATKIKLEIERIARAGDPPTDRLQSDWRERMEDMVWALVNSPEFVFVP